MGIIKNTIEMKVLDSDKLTLDFTNSGHSLPAGHWLGGLPLGNRPPNHIVTRYPWESVPSNWYQGLSLSLNLNPDPNKIEDYNNRKLVNNILLQYINNEAKIQKAIGVYEWGKYGAEYGKLHYHIALKTTHRKDVEEELLKLFNDRPNCAHRTLTVKPFKDVKHRTDFINYMKKENQNKIKCLFIKNL